MRLRSSLAPLFLHKNVFNIFKRGTVSSFPQVNFPDTISICSFNVLAPLYSSNDMLFYWKKRHTDISDYLNSIPASIFCIEEFWFNEEFLRIYSNPKFLSYSLQRPKRKEGLAIFVDKTRLKNVKIVNSLHLNFGVYGDRIALMLHIKVPSLFQDSKDIDCANLDFGVDYPMEFLVVCTHLTYAEHSSFLRDVQLLQITKLTKWIENYVEVNDLGGITAFISGDFNAQNHDSVHRFLKKKKEAISSFEYCNGREVIVSHRTHSKRDVGVDFIYSLKTKRKKRGELKEIEGPFASFNPIYSKLLPLEYSDIEWPSNYEWNLSDHRPIYSLFRSSCPQVLSKR